MSLVLFSEPLRTEVWQGPVDGAVSGLCFELFCPADFAFLCFDFLFCVCAGGAVVVAASDHGCWVVLARSAAVAACFLFVAVTLVFPFDDFGSAVVALACFASRSLRRATARRLFARRVFFVMASQKAWEDSELLEEPALAAAGFLLGVARYGKLFDSHHLRRM